MKTYAQVIGNHVNLIGGEEAGMPLPEIFLRENPHILNIDISDLAIKPEIGWHYEDGVFYESSQWHEKYPAKEEHNTMADKSDITEPSNTEIMQKLNDIQIDLLISGVIKDV